MPRLDLGNGDADRPLGLRLGEPGGRGVAGAVLGHGGVQVGQDLDACAAGVLLPLARAAARRRAGRAAWPCGSTGPGAAATPTWSALTAPCRTAAGTRLPLSRTPGRSARGFALRTRPSSPARRRRPRTRCRRPASSAGFPAGSACGRRSARRPRPGRAAHPTAPCRTATATSRPGRVLVSAHRPVEQHRVNVQVRLPVAVVMLREQRRDRAGAVTELPGMRAVVAGADEQRPLLGQGDHLPGGLQRRVVDRLDPRLELIRRRRVAALARRCRGRRRSWPAAGSRDLVAENVRS